MNTPCSNFPKHLQPFQHGIYGPRLLKTFLKLTTPSPLPKRTGEGGLRTPNPHPLRLEDGGVTLRPAGGPRSSPEESPAGFGDRLYATEDPKAKLLPGISRALLGLAGRENSGRSQKIELAQRTRAGFSGKIWKMPLQKYFENPGPHPLPKRTGGPWHPKALRVQPGAPPGRASMEHL